MEIEELDHESGFTSFRSMRSKVGWLANTPPDLLFEISKMAQISHSLCFEQDSMVLLKRLNCVIRYADNNVAHLKFPSLERDDVRIVGDSDAAYSNNRDLMSQLGRVILLMDRSDIAIPVSFESYKSRRITRSVLSTETIAFADEASAWAHSYNGSPHRFKITI